MRNAQKPDHVSLNTLISRLRDGRYVIPDFQREFEWEPWDISGLMRSIFLDYYIGSLLLWKGSQENFDALSCEKIYGYDGRGAPEFIVLDGQQRLTAMYYAFTAPDVPLPRRKYRAYYFIHIDKLMADDHDEAFSYEWDSWRINRLIADQTTQFREHVFPLSIVGASGWELPNWVQGYEAYWSERAAEGGPAERSALEDARSFSELIRTITQEYQISFIELDQELGVDKVCDIFTQINSRGVRLDVFDLMNALLKPKGLQLKHMWRDAVARLEFVDTRKMNVYILQVMSILRQAYCSPKYLYFLLPGQPKPVRASDGTRGIEVLVQDGDAFDTLWNQAVDALEEAIRTLRHPQEYGAVSSTYLPYISILPAFAALQEAVRQLPADRRLDAGRKVRHWYWASVFTSRYSGAMESTTARDYLSVTKWLEDDAAKPSVVDDLENRFRNLDLRGEVRRGSSVYNGIFNLLVVQGARDWISGKPPQHDDLDDHHIVPAAWGREHLDSNDINSVLNRTPLTADTNRNVIGNRLPNEYLPRLIANNGQDMVDEILASHFISKAAQKILLRDPFTPDDFQAFLAERQRTLLDAIEALLVKQRLDLSPSLRELDARIEEIELQLRALVAHTLGNDPSQLPPHVQVKLDQRLRVASRSNATLDLADFEALDRRLEYSDLRELQDSIMSKQSWPLFEEHFITKESLDVKFGQFAALRNAIRHSREVDGITRKEGEAALLWFDQILNRAVGSTSAASLR